MNLLRKIFITVCLLFIACPAAASTIYVDGGSTSTDEDGSEENPFKTIISALNVAYSGDKIIVAPHVYNESLDITTQVTIEGTGDLGAVIDAGGSSWYLDAPNITLRNLRFVGQTSGTAVRAYSPFTMERCQVEGYYRALFVRNAGALSVIRHNRFVGAKQPIYFYKSGWSTYSKFENNIVVGTGSSYGVIMYNSRARLYHNLISGATDGIIYYQSSGFSLPVSYLINNLIVDSYRGVRAVGVTNSEVKVYGNAIQASITTEGVPASDEIFTIEDGCGAPAYGWNEYDCGFVPSGPCIDGGIFGFDPDGSGPDIGPFGGDSGGPWWIRCEGEFVDCPADDYTALLANPGVAAALEWFDGDTWPWDEPMNRVLRCDLEWYGAFSEITEPPELPAMVDRSNISPIDSWQIWKQEDAERTFRAHLAHRLWLEVSELVPWSLVNPGIYTPDNLALLLSASSHFGADYTSYTRDTGLVTDWDPRFTWDFAANHIKQDHEETIAALLNANSCSRHIHLGYSNMCYYHYSTGFPPVEAVISTRWHAGCHVAAGMIISLGKALNIPVEYYETEYQYGAHGGISYPTIGRYTNHGDDIGGTKFLGDVSGLAVMPDVGIDNNDTFHFMYLENYYSAEAVSPYWQWETCPNGWLYGDPAVVQSVLEGTYEYFGYSEIEAAAAAYHKVYNEIIPARDEAGGCDAFAWMQDTGDLRFQVCSGEETYYPEHLAECVMPYCDPDQVSGWDKPECSPDWW